MSFERRKVRVGLVVGDKMDKTVVVAVEWRRPYALYRKSVRRRTKFKAHDENNEYRIGDTVRIRETRPLSKTKRWRVIELLQREEVAEIQPDEIVVEELEALNAPEPPPDATTETDDAAAQDDAPTAMAEDAPATAQDDAPTAMAEDAPAAAQDDAPTAMSEDAPAAAQDDAPAATTEDAPTATTDDPPAATPQDADAPEESARP